RSGVPVGHAPSRVEHVNRIVADTLDEHPKLLLAFVESFLLVPLGCDVARDPGEAKQAAVGRADGIEYGVRPELGSVLADTPAFGFESPLAGGYSQGAPRHVGGAIFGSEEARKMLADDLVGRIALEALGAGIPGC